MGTGKYTRRHGTRGPGSSPRHICGHQRCGACAARRSDVLIAILILVALVVVVELLAGGNLVLGEGVLRLADCGWCASVELRDAGGPPRTRHCACRKKGQSVLNAVKEEEDTGASNGSAGHGEMRWSSQGRKREVGLASAARDARRQKLGANSTTWAASQVAVQCIAVFSLVWSTRLLLHLHLRALPSSCTPCHGPTASSGAPWRCVSCSLAWKRCIP